MQEASFAQRDSSWGITWRVVNGYSGGDINTLNDAVQCSQCVVTVLLCKVLARYVRRWKVGGKAGYKQEEARCGLVRGKESEGRDKDVAGKEKVTVMSVLLRIAVES